MLFRTRILPRCTWSINAFSPTEVDFIHIAQPFMKIGDAGVRDFPGKNAAIFNGYMEIR